MTTSDDFHRRFSRRSFMRAAGVAVSIPALAQLSACSNTGGAIASGGSNELVVPISSSPWLSAYKKVTAMYQTETGVKVTLREFPYEGLRSALVNSIRGDNQSFDMFLLDEPWTGEFYDNKWVAPFTDVDPSFKLDPQIATFNNLLYWDAKSRVASKSGQVVALPIEGSMTLFMYRKDLYNELGLSLPKTFEEAVANGRKAQQAGRAKYGYAARGQASTGGQAVTFDFMPLLYGYGGDWFDKNWNPLVGRPEAINAMQRYKELLTLGPANPNTVGLAAVIAAMQSGDALQIHTVASAAFQMNDPNLSNVAGKVGFAPMPAGSGGTSAPTSNAWSMAIPRANAKDRQQAALKFISWLLEKKSQLKFTDDDGIPTRSDVLQAAGGNQKYLPAVSSSLPNVRGALRYTFTAQMVAVTEPALSSIATGRTPVEEGMKELAKKLAEIAREAGYGN